MEETMGNATAAPKRLWEIADELGEIEALVAENEGNSEFVRIS